MGRPMVLLIPHWAPHGKMDHPWGVPWDDLWDIPWDDLFDDPWGIPWGDLWDPRGIIRFGHLVGFLKGYPKSITMGRPMGWLFSHGMSDISSHGRIMGLPMGGPMERYAARRTSHGRPME